ncbi:MAG: IS110 family transposase [Runella slithyformis]|nr:MAG: IS110 family transposase [Runella slithyformis]
MSLELTGAARAVSKPFFDAALMPVVNHQKQAIEVAHFENNELGLKAFEKWLKKHKVAFDQNTVLVIENTGIYHRLLWAFCNKIGLQIHIGNAAHIKWSFGIARGKNDEIDAMRLCKYACKESDELKLSKSLNPKLMQLKDLQTSRTRLLSQKNANQTYLKELKNINDKATQKTLEQAYKTAIEGIKKSIDAIEKLIKDLIKTDDALQKSYDLLVSVPGIGSITAIYLIVCTNNFAGNISGKQLASYAGVAPFGNSSGISIKKREKVHKMANKELKKILHMGAMSVIHCNPEMKQYYDRKVSEGKHALSVINAVKNKLVLRAVAVIKSQTPYVDNFVKPEQSIKNAA